MYEFKPFSEEVKALRLGARRRSTGLCAYELQVCEPFTLRRGVAYIEFAGPLLPLVMQGFKVHLRLGVTDNAPNKVL